MDRRAPYADASVNRYVASQMPQMSAQRMQQNAQINDFSAQIQFPSRGQRWDTNPPIELNPMSPHSHSQGHKGNVIHSQERIVNQKVNHENQGNNDPRLESYEQDMEIGYEDKNPWELSFEELEKKFQDEIMKLIKELGNAEDEENARHKERLIDINTQYQEKLSSLRVEHASRIGEFLRKEALARLHQHQQAAMSTHLAERGTRDYGWPEAGRPYGDDYYRGAKRSQGSEVRVPYPHGRVYNYSGGRY